MRITNAQGISLDDVKRAAISALQAQPHSLTVEQFGHEGIEGIGHQGRSSSVLPNLFEWPTVQVSVFSNGPSMVELRVKIKILVSPRRLDGWRALREDERSTYKASVRDALKSQLQLLCAGTWGDDFSFRCP
jgi:hypothetical protein